MAVGAPRGDRVAVPCIPSGAVSSPIPYAEPSRGSQVFEDFRYVREIGADIGSGARDHALVFEARVGDKQIEGCDFIQLDEDGAISSLTVMVRPMSGAMALAEAMTAQLSSA
jgi:hypothetical protein